MKAVRVTISLFIALLIVVSVAGWIWTGAHQPTAQWIASRAVLGISALAGAFGLVVIWRGQPRRHE